MRAALILAAPPARHIVARTRPINSPPIQQASITWVDGLPRAQAYGDIYFSSADPLQESRHVFIDGNNLPARMTVPGSQPLVIGECGFGFGLNFLLACQIFLQQAPPGSCLHYLGTELHPVAKADLQRYYTTLPPPLQGPAERLFASYPLSRRGLHRLTFAYPGHRIVLDLAYGDADNALQSACLPDAGIDAWFLDGFAPDRNPAMWNAGLCRTLASLSHAGTTLATYSVAGNVRRNLEAAGFTVCKSPGFGPKRHMLTGTYGGLAIAGNLSWRNPWPLSRHHVERIAVIGAGLAGCATAHALSSRGKDVTVIERNQDIASASSGNPRGIVHAKPALRLTAATRFHLQAYAHALRHYQALSAHREFGWSATGVIQLAMSAAEQEHQDKLANSGLYDSALFSQLSAAAVTERAGVHVRFPGLLFPAGGSLDPRALCRAWLETSQARLLTGTGVTGLALRDGLWHATLANAAGSREEIFDTVVICNNHDALQFGVLPEYPIIANHGRSDTYRVADAGLLPALPLCHQGYCIPWQDQDKAMVTIGGSFAQGVHTSADREFLAGQNRGLATRLAAGLDGMFTGKADGRIQTRTTMPDYLPLVGPVEDTEACLARFAGYRRNARKEVPSRPAYLPGLYVNLAHGSHGLTHIPLVAEYLASLVCTEPVPLPFENIAAIHPLRFLIKALKRQER